jgi:hypothetical protein
MSDIQTIVAPRSGMVERHATRVSRASGTRVATFKVAAPFLAVCEHGTEHAAHTAHEAWTLTVDPTVWCESCRTAKRSNVKPVFSKQDEVRVLTGFMG